MFALPLLPYASTALEPYLSRRAVELHYSVLHRGYIERVNTLLPAEWGLVDLLDIAVQADVEGRGELYAAALQAWNHHFYWGSMRVPNGVPGVTGGPLGALIKRDYGSLGELREAFVRAGVARTGSGWVWLTLDQQQQLHVEATIDTDNPVFGDRYPILVCDVWEHSYYLDYGPERAEYLSTWFDLLANFGFAEQNTRRILQFMADAKGQ